MRLGILISATILILALVSCEKPERSIGFSGLTHLNELLYLSEEVNLVIEPGTEIIFGPNGSITGDGSIIAMGTEEAPIIFRGNKEMATHTIISLTRESDEFTMTNAIVEDGLIISKADNNHITNVHITNTKELYKFDALIRLWYGSVYIENCLAESNNYGEGFLIHNVDKPKVINCSFHQVPDAVEYIECPDGEIAGCLFKDMEDDGIDLNACYRTLIRNNEFYNIGDRGLELGSEAYGSSHDLEVNNNLFVNCDVAINLKESSSVHISNVTLYFNKIAFQLINSVDSLNITTMTVDNSVVVTDRFLASVGEKSNLKMNNTMSNRDISEFGENTTSEISFSNPDAGDYTISEGVFPDGLNANSIGFQRQ